MSVLYYCLGALLLIMVLINIVFDALEKRSSEHHDYKDSDYSFDFDPGDLTRFLKEDPTKKNK